MSSAAHTGAPAKAIRAGVQLTGALDVNATQQKDSREIRREDTHTTEKLRIHEMSFHSKTLHKPNASRRWKTQDKGAEMPEKESRGPHSKGTKHQIKDSNELGGFN